MTMSKKDPYSILGVSREADKAEIKKAYRSLAMKYHPDRNPGKESEDKFKEASEAADILLDEEKRRLYDRFGYEGLGQGGLGGGANPGDIFSEIFGDVFNDFFGGGSRSTRRRGTGRGKPGDDLEIGLSLPFELAALGGPHSFKIKRKKPCGTCEGSGLKKGSSQSVCEMCEGHGQVLRRQGFFTIQSVCPQCKGSGEIIKNPCPDCRGLGVQKEYSKIEVDIPAGIDEGQRMKLSGQGNAGQFGGPSGDLYILIDIQSHPFFRREEFDIYTVLPIKFSDAVLGGLFEMPTLHGKVEVNIPKGVQSGTRLRIKGKGVPVLGRSSIGDHYVEVQVETPTSLGVEERALFEKLASAESQETHPLRETFLNFLNSYDKE